jgi:hypothetical protein
MVLYLTSGRATGYTFPVTADKAYIIAMGWKSSSTRVADSRGVIANGTVLMLADEERALVIVVSPVALNWKL